MKNTHLVLSPQGQWALMGHNALALGPTSPPNEEKKTNKEANTIRSKK